MPDTLTQTVTTESLSSTSSGQTVLQSVLSTQLMELGILGPPGPAGPTGPAGPAGSGGGEGGDVPVPTFPIVDAKFVADLAAGASDMLDSVIIPGGKIGKVQQITLSSSAAAKWELYAMSGGVPTALDTVFTSGMTGNTPSHEWEPPHRDYAEVTGNGSTTFFRVTVTNLDARNPANAYVTFFFDEVDV